jgi:hypothetical protein
MAAQVCANPVLHEDVPERGTADRLNVALILSRKTVDREYGVVPDNELVSDITV